MNIFYLKIIYIQYIRSVLEYGANVWHSGFTNQNRNDIERLQKSSLKIILNNIYVNYKRALKFLNMDSLETRREKLNLTFAKKCLKIERMKHLFPLNSKNLKMKIRDSLK